MELNGVKKIMYDKLVDRDMVNKGSYDPNDFERKKDVSIPKL